MGREGKEGRKEGRKDGRGKNAVCSSEREESYGKSSDDEPSLMLIVMIMITPLFINNSFTLLYSALDGLVG